MKTQAISLLTLSVLLAQDTLKGSWVTATGETPSGQAPLLGVTDTDGKQGQMVSVTAIGTASMNLKDIATNPVKAGDLVVYEDMMMIAKANQSAQYAGKVVGVVLYDAHQDSHAEILIR